MPITSKSILSTIKATAGHVGGGNARKLRNAATVLKDAKGMGIPGIQDASISRASRLAQVAEGKSTNARIKVGLGAAATLGGGALAVHGQHKYKENRILGRIDKMYGSQ